MTEAGNVLPVLLCIRCSAPHQLGDIEYKMGEQPKRYPGAEDTPPFGKEEIQPFNCTNCGTRQNPALQEVEYWSKMRIVAWKPTRPKPVAICTRCNAVYDVTGINERCGRTVNGNERCGGGISSALNDSDWEECPSCVARGEKGGAICAPCAGSGWLFVRDMPWLRKTR
jgi:hypothetical protein